MKVDKKYKMVPGKSYPKEIFIWICEDEISRNHFPNKGKAFISCINKFTLPESFGCPKYIPESIFVQALEFIKSCKDAHNKNNAIPMMVPAHLDLNEYKKSTIP